MLRHAGQVAGTYHGGVTSGVEAVFTDDERAVLLDAAADDERQGRLVRCSTAAEVAT
jgi:hypothetical protein